MPKGIYERKKARKATVRKSGRSRATKVSPRINEFARVAKSRAEDDGVIPANDQEINLAETARYIKSLEEDNARQANLIEQQAEALRLSYEKSQINSSQLDIYRRALIEYSLRELLRSGFKT